MFNNKEIIAYTLLLIASFCFFLFLNREQPLGALLVENHGSRVLVQSSRPVSKEVEPVSKVGGEVVDLRDQVPFSSEEEKAKLNRWEIPIVQQEGGVVQKPNQASLSRGDLSSPLAEIPLPAMVDQQQPGPLVVVDHGQSSELPVQMIESSPSFVEQNMLQGGLAPSAKIQSMEKTEPVDDGEDRDPNTDQDVDVAEQFLLKISLPQHHVTRKISSVEISLRWDESLVSPVDMDAVCYDTSGIILSLSMLGPVMNASVTQIFAFPVGVRLPLDLMVCRFQTLADLGSIENKGIFVYDLKVSDYNGLAVPYMPEQVKIEVAY